MLSPVAPRRRRAGRSRALRPRKGLLLLLGLLVVGAGCIPLVEPSTSGKQYGKGPIDAVRDAAEATTRCPDLSAAQLAAMMLVPTYPESGGAVPSPMTLSRWDNLSQNPSNANLFAFGQTTGSYVNAFFSPGIGPWQFDSAGGWNLSAAGAIDSVGSATQAAATMAYRFCHAPTSTLTDPAARRRYAWGPWYGCTLTTNTACEDSYQALYADEALDLAPDASVTRYGGMLQRTCDFGAATGVTCWFVDPALAEGSTGWRAGTYDPARPNFVTPLPKPFYVVENGGYEYRIWLKADTGYDIDITARRPMTANARTSLVWQNTAVLCDRTTGRGVCGTSSTTTSTTAPTTTTSTTAPPTTTTTTPPPTVPSGTAFSLFLRNSATGGIADSTVRFGPTRQAQILVCDWNGDGVDTPAAFLSGQWTVSDRPDGALARTFAYGNATGDVAVCGDWNGDGADGPGVVRSGVWYLANSTQTGRADVVTAFGNASGDLPVVGDWDGNGTDTIGVVRGGYWYLANSFRGGFADRVFGYGNATGDWPVVGDWDGNGTSDPGVFRRAGWFLAASVSNPVATKVFLYGDTEDRPIAGSWTGGAASTPGVVR